MSKRRDKDRYLKQYSESKKWLNQCIICNSIGYKPELPEKIYPGLLAQNIRKYFQPLPINDLNICETCSSNRADNNDLASKKNKR
jgi:hypothetical protein